MKLKDLLKLLKCCMFMVIALDSGLRTDCISHWDTDNPQLRTLLDKVVKVVCPRSSESGSILEVEVEDSTPRVAELEGQ